MSEDGGNSTSRPVVGSVIAGFPSPAEQYVEPPLDLNSYLIKRPAATFFVRVQGDSMIDAGIFEGDILVVDRSITAYNGAIVVANIDNEYTLKYFRRENGRVFLEPANKAYMRIDIAEGQELTIFGVVTAVVRKFGGIKK